MSDFVKGLVKTYRIYRTAKLAAIFGGVVFSGGAIAIPVIAAEIAENLAEEGIKELLEGSAGKLFSVTAEKIGEETVFKYAGDVITSEKALELIEKGYSEELLAQLGGENLIDGVGLAGSVGSLDLYQSTQASEAEDNSEGENSQLANNCSILINNFLLTQDERKQLIQHLGTLIKIDNPIEQNKQLQRLLARLRKSNEHEKNGRDLFNINGQLNLGYA